MFGERSAHEVLTQTVVRLQCEGSTRTHEFTIAVHADGCVKMGA